jgi:hypothetical protein
MARTAVIAGTAGVTMNAVNNHNQKNQQEAAMDQQQAMMQQQEMMAQQAAPAAPTGMTEDKVNQLKSIAELKSTGVLTDAEFEVQKAKILSS